MRKSVKFALSTVTAMLLLCGAISSASSRSISVSDQSFRVSWSSLEFQVREVTTIRCRVTLEGSFHTRTIAKVARALIGAISRAIVSHPCTGGEAWMDNGVENTPGGRFNRLPFHFTYENFVAPTGLPNITAIGVLLSRTSFVIQAGGLCTGRYGTSEDNISLVAAIRRGGFFQTLERIVSGINKVWHLVRQLGGIFCPRELTLEGAGAVAGLSAGEISVSLI
jgi:hypothetical protein